MNSVAGNVHITIARDNPVVRLAIRIGREVGQASSREYASDAICGSLLTL